ncbi:uncharacterized protein DSM5745_08587 [Aspergillus mulundensis]|uniref:Clr5 domain-containing protein n=1 Tax=Aspergillus mulundensis TaxID=1810919 RepID=A0A3D8R4B1_9EURO|nr:hypothetical protein DSM5745_08587 [Aspergillus mulundensis]RDW68827.1 hypothetical protein DSM5745_08587 [Aspergillus mulundensis]
MNEDEWQAFRPEIQRLYIDENKTLPEVRRHLESRYGFRGTKTQYERRLKKWGLVKNQKVSDLEWKFIGRRIHKRKLAGKHKSDVYKYGRQVPPGTVKTAVYGGKAYVPTTMLARESSPSTPDSILVCSPASPGLHFSSKHPLPWQSFSKLLPTDYIQHEHHSFSTTVSPRWEIMSPSCEWKQRVRTHLSLAVPWIKLDCLSGKECCSRDASAVMALMPNHETLASRSCQDANHSLDLFEIQLFLMSNSFGVSDAQNMETLRISGLDRLDRFQTLLTVEEPTAAAVAERLFASALRLFDINIVSMMLKAGMNANGVLSSTDTPGQETMSYLEYAAESSGQSGRELLELLLSHGADANLRDYSKPAMRRAICRKNTGAIEKLLLHGAIVAAKDLAAAAKYLDDMALFEHLLAACPDVNPDMDPDTYSALAEAVMRQNVHMISLLLARGADPAGTVRVGLRSGAHGFTTHLGLAIQTNELSVIEAILNARNSIVHDEIDQSSRSEYISPLALAVDRGNPGLVDLLVQAGADPRAEDPSRGLTLLEMAVTQNNIDMCRTLLAYGAPVDPPSHRRKQSPLSVAVDEERVDMVSLLLSAGARVNDEYDELPGTVLARAIEHGNVLLVDLLLNAGAERVGGSLRCIGNLKTAVYLRRANRLQSILDISGAAVLAISILSEDDALAQFLLDHSFDVNGTTVFDYLWHCACSDDDPIYVRVPETTPLSAALQTGKIRLAADILARGAEITDPDLGAALQHSLSESRDGWFYYLLDRASGHAPTAIGIAIMAGRADILQLMLSKGVSPEGVPKLKHTWQLRGPKYSLRFDEPHSVLEVAVMENNERILRTLCDSHPWGETQKGRALSLAIVFRRDELVEYLLQETLDMNQEVHVHFWNPNGHYSRADSELEKSCTPLQAAVLNQDAFLVQQILKNPTTDIDHCSNDHHAAGTALLLAVKHGNMQLVDILLDHGADVNRRCNLNGDATPLQCAARKGFLGIARRLLDHGADINYDPKHWLVQSALVEAATHGRIDMVQMLLNEGASVVGAAGRKQYKEAVSNADGNGHHAVAELIRAFKHRKEVEMRPVLELDSDNDMS